MPARDFLRHNWHAITISVTAAAIGCAAVVMLSSMPPRLLVMATGPEGDAYYEIGERYRAELARANVELRLVPTAGSVENLARLRDPHSGVSVALVEGGIVPPQDSSALESLGVVFFEPLWWFRRREIEGVGLRGRKISIGPEGSGTRALSLELIKRSGMEGLFGQVLALPPRAAGDQLLAGQIDVAFMLAPLGVTGSAAASCRRAHRAFRLSPCGCSCGAVSVSEPGGGAQGRDRHFER